MNQIYKKAANAKLRQNRVRSKIHGTAERPRLSVNISNMHITAQVIDDDKHITLAYATTVGKKMTGNMTDNASEIGKDIAVKAKKLKINKVALDRGSKLYHGRVQALADAARKGGLEF